MRDWSGEVLRRLASLNLPPAREVEIVEEVAQHLEDRYRELVSGGSKEDEARRLALNELSDEYLLAKGLRAVEQEAPQEPTVLGGGGRHNFLGSIWQDLRYGLRQLLRNPGFTAVAVLTLALGIGATTSIFSAVEAVLLRPLPFRDPGRLVLIKENVNKLDTLLNLPAPDVLTFAHDSRAFEQVGGFERGSMELSGVGEPVRIATARLTAAVFPALGVSPTLGRAFTPREDDGDERLAVISYDLWKSRFLGEPRIVGQRIDLDRIPYIVCGVMPAGFEFPLAPGKLNQTQLWVSMSFTPQERADAGDNFQYGAVARLRPGVTPAQADEDANRVAAEIQAGYPAKMGIRVTATLVPLKEFTVAKATPLLRVLFGAVTVLLLIACANVAGLLLVRGVRRQREVAVRQALGASKLAVLRQCLRESAEISFAGGLLGVFLAWAGLRWFVSVLPETLPRLGEIGLNWPVMAFALAVTAGAGLLSGLAPALSSMRTNVNEVLKGSDRTLDAGSASTRLRAALVVGEVAMALMLLTGAGLLLRSFAHMRAVDPGFEPQHLVAASFDLPRERYQTQEQVDSFNKELVRLLQRLPGVKSAALASVLPMAEPTSTRFFVAEGYQPPQGGSYAVESHAYVVGDYLQTMRIPLLRGRYLKASDTADAPLVVVVSRDLAERYWPGQNPIGKRIHWGVDVDSSLPWMSVVGEVANTKQGPLDSQAWPQAYEPLAQYDVSFGPEAAKLGVHGDSMRIAARALGDPRSLENEVRRAVWSLDPQLAVSQMQTMEEAISESEAPRRFNTTVLTSFALGAVLLAALGLYAVIAFSVSQRTHEIGIRMALGARRSDVLRLVVGQGLKLTLIGVAIGNAGALGLTRFLASLLYDVKPTDQITFIAVSLILTTAALLACFVPARRATKVDPMVALRYE